jgi:hypothetical protein
MLKKKKIYLNYSKLEDIGGEDGQIDIKLAKLELNIIKDVEVSYFISNSKQKYEHKTEKISFKEFQYRMINNKEFTKRVFEIIAEGEDYEIRLSGGEIWVRSFDKRKADLIYNQLTLL